MAKIINFNDTQIDIGLDNGELLSVPRSTVNFFPNIGDQVEVFKNGETVVINKTASAVNPNAKSKLIAGLLGIFVGGIGIHNFYLGKTGRGVAQIIVTIVTCGVGYLWGFIEGIIIITSKQGSPWHQDADGNELADS